MLRRAEFPSQFGPTDLAVEGRQAFQAGLRRNDVEVLRSSVSRDTQEVASGTVLDFLQLYVEYPASRW